jgi:hypothetical protein
MLPLTNGNSGTAAGGIFVSAPEMKPVDSWQMMS